jgi:hypothetical protein
VRATFTNCPGQSFFPRSRSGLEANRPRRRVHRIVRERHDAPRRLGLAGGEGVDLELPLRHVPVDGGELLLGHRERHVDRLHLVDDEERRVAGAPDPDDIALVEHEASRAAVDRRANARIAELKLGVVDDGFIRAGGLLGRLDGGLVGAHRVLGALHVRLVGAHRGGEGLGIGADAVVLLLCDHPRPRRSA